MRSYPELSASRFQAVADYMRAEVLDGTYFKCASQDACRASASPHFYSGQLSHLGRHYDLEKDGRSFRIVVVGQEYGTPQFNVDLTERRRQLAQSAHVGFSGRNPHMRGTTSILRLLHGREVGVDASGEQLLDGHLFDGFALVNFLLCSAIQESRPDAARGAGKGASTPVMRGNCVRHFSRTLEILEPDIVVVQGVGVRRWLSPAVADSQCFDGVERARIGGHRVDLLTFHHPSAPGLSGWWGNSPRARYLTETVEPTIRRYLAHRHNIA